MPYHSQIFARKPGNFYMTLEGFSNFRKCERMVAKIKFLVPFHLLDHVIIPINVWESNWFPAYMDVKFRRMSFLDSSYAYSAADYGRKLRQKLHGRKCFCKILPNGMDSPRQRQCPSSFLGRAPSEDHVITHKTDRTHTINGAGTRKAERHDSRQHK